jgi:hypothetical protein
MALISSHKRPTRWYWGSNFIRALQNTGTRAAKLLNLSRVQHYNIASSRGFVARQTSGNAWLTVLENELGREGFKFDYIPDGVRFKPSDPGGIAVLVMPEKCRVTVAFGGWYDDFTDSQSLLDIVRRALTGGVRVRVDFANNRAFRWAVESIDGCEWREVGVMESIARPPSDETVRSYYVRNRPPRI